jgi:hypothetical protein
MTDLLDLLESKVKCLNYFVQVSRDFLQRCEEGKVEGIDEFHSARESALKLLVYLDERVDASVPRWKPASRETAVQRVRALEAERKRLVGEIIRIDEKIMKHLQQERDRVQTEIYRSQRSLDTIGKFKSGWVQESGVELDKEI